MKKIIYFFLLFAFFIIQVSAYAQCAMCKSGVASNLEGGGNTGRGINTGILYLMAIPYLLIGGLIVYVFRKRISEKFKELKAQYFTT
jgi:LPXTG-motif cell wall-anchored protein